jgi:prevent-host-death family protein
MAKTYTFTEARQNLATVLAQAEKDGEVHITHRSGKVFVLRPERSDRSPLDVPGVDTGISRQEILDSIREGRQQDVRERRTSYKLKE